MFHFEHVSAPILRWPVFIRRLIRSASLGFALILFSLGFGMLGYHYLEHLSWIDAYANASMILSGMGPLDLPKTNIGKLFAGFYALYSGLAVVVVAGITFAPVFHRFLHTIHCDDVDCE